MITESVEVNISEYQGKRLEKPINEKVDVSLFENVSELRNAGKFPNDGDILDMVNAKIKVAARAKRTQELTKSLKEDYEKTDEFKVKSMVKMARVANFPLAELEAMIARAFPDYQGDALVGYDA